MCLISFTSIEEKIFSLNYLEVDFESKMYQKFLIIHSIWYYKSVYTIWIFNNLQMQQYYKLQDGKNDNRSQILMS